MQTFVGISRKYGQKQTEMSVYGKDEGGTAVSVSMPLDDFVDALIKEVESVTWVFTQKEFERRMQAAKDAVVDEMKKTTIPHAHNIPLES